MDEHENNADAPPPPCERPHFACLQCGKRCRDADGVGQHYDAKYQNKGFDHRCTPCGNRFKINDARDYHQNYECEQIGYLRELGYPRDVFEERYGNFLEYFVNQKFVENLGSKLSIIRCNSKAFEWTMFKPPVSAQALFYFSLRCVAQMLKPEHGHKELIEQIDKQIPALGFHIQNYYWLDFTLLSDIYNKSEEGPYTALDKVNFILAPIEDWMFDLIGNVIPAHMDFWWFLVGNSIVILSSLATAAQATAMMDLLVGIWEDLIREMPVKIAYPALEEHQWKIVTGGDPKNTQFSYHNGELWSAASIKTGTPQIGKRAIGLVEQCLSMDGWPEYFDGKTGRYIGKQALKYQTWSIAGYLVVKMMIENPSYLLSSCFLDQAKTHP